MEGSELRLSKPYLLLTYMVLAKNYPDDPASSGNAVFTGYDRKEIANLFWPVGKKPKSGGRDPRKNLSTALSEIRRKLGEGIIVSSTDRIFPPNLEADAAKLLGACARGDWPLITEIYKAPFLKGADSIKGIDYRIQNWINGFRNVLTLKVWDTCLQQASLKDGQFDCGLLAEGYAITREVSYDDEANKALLIFLKQEAHPLASDFEKEFLDPKTIRRRISLAHGLSWSDPISIPSRPWNPDISPPGALLRADIHGAVGFHGRKKEMDDLQNWCKDKIRRIGIRLYTGSGGMGKTRLFIELCKAFKKEGWRAGFLQSYTENQEVSYWSKIMVGPLPCLFVIDYGRFAVKS